MGGLWGRGVRCEQHWHRTDSVPSHPSSDQQHTSDMKSYHLKWSSHLPNMGLVFSTLYQSEGLSDVTLYCDDGSIRAHKLLLSTCSDFFLELFLENNTKRPVIVLSGVKVSDLRAIMQFIYTGEVNVTEEDLSDLLEVAEMLGVRGLKAGADKESEKVSQEGEEGKDVPSEKGDEDHGVNEKSEDIVPSISITPVASTPEKKETSNKSSDSFQISVKKDLTNNLIVSDCNDIVDVNNTADIAEDDIAEDIEEENMINSDKTDTANFTSPLQSMLSPVSSQYSSYFSTPTSPSSFMRPGLPMAASMQSPLVSMSNLAAMYQQQQQQLAVSPSKQIREKTASVISEGQKPLDWYKQCSQEGKISLDLLPEDINSIMSQSTTPFCPLCNKDCANFPNLRSHLQVHNSIRPYACTYCEAKFARVSHLNRHIRTHTGERPFACERCGKSFARQDKLKLHMDRHLSRENKNEIMSQLMSPNSKKIKLENSFKQEVMSTNPTSSQMVSPVTNNSYMMTGSNNTSLWGAFPLYNTTPQAATYQPVYPGMVPQYLTQQTNHATMSELHNVMKIGECSIKPLGSQQ